MSDSQNKIARGAFVAEAGICILPSQAGAPCEHCGRIYSEFTVADVVWKAVTCSLVADAVAGHLCCKCFLHQAAMRITLLEAKVRNLEKMMEAPKDLPKFEDIPTPESGKVWDKLTNIRETARPLLDHAQELERRLTIAQHTSQTLLARLAERTSDYLEAAHRRTLDILKLKVENRRLQAGSTARRE